jgi:hypothetical protein
MGLGKPASPLLTCCLTACRTNLHLTSKSIQVPCLQIDSSGALELAGQAFSGAEP